MRPNYHEERYDLLVKYVEEEFDTDLTDVSLAIAEVVEEARDEGRFAYVDDIREKL